ncbi:MAG: phosphatase PAP2 family protein [Nocardioides sp.]
MSCLIQAHTRGRAGVRSRRLDRATAIQLGVLVVLAVAYTLIRAAQGTDAAAALANGRDILSAERWLFDSVELPFNRWLSTVTVLAVPACYFYAVFHYAATPFVLYRSWRVGGWTWTRGYWALVIASGVGLVLYMVYPAAPPRLLPGIGTVDVMRVFADYGWWGDAASAPRALGDATNQYAAMPSLHFGWSLWCGIQMWSFSGRWWRIAAVVYPTLQVIVVIGTANHFFSDVVVGGLCVVIAFGVVYLARRMLQSEVAHDSVGQAR